MVELVRGITCRRDMLRLWDWYIDSEVRIKAAVLYDAVCFDVRGMRCMEDVVLVEGTPCRRCGILVMICDRGNSKDGVCSSVSHVEYDSVLST
jgi:hypothetical protein